ncbi:hypothetical protein AF335_08090 [Streptomyces eurocidicus]|uniref:Lipoprotein n=1 Tax=Streptomyces eurocidicus TaxID=66423 RepID=A0A2N8P0H2_STREU|nr:hypothetical protein [Streptomyces eurocidicus]MBB5121643.1 hypothetical protein [Streptomyces eurocidicus]MBF6052872.1 hypothetical protein [Streptomyces eurocidicus]PNE34517.1 hypothetical protein AF335_08090 [Streptomyces eurocidicus]
MTPVRGTRTWTAAAVAAAVTILCAAPPASGEPRAASAPCVTREGVEHIDWTGMWFDHDVVCDNSPSELRLQTYPTSPVVSMLLTTRSWVVCWKTGDPPPGGNEFYYYTQGNVIVDRPGAKGWGYLPGHLLYADGHPAPGVPKCRWA